MRGALRSLKSGGTGVHCKLDLSTCGHLARVSDGIGRGNSEYEGNNCGSEPQLWLENLVILIERACLIEKAALARGLKTFLR